MTADGRAAHDRRAAALARRARRAEVTDADVVMEAAAAFLAVRQRSVAEVRRRLRHLGYPPGLVDEVVDRLVELGYLDDVAFARSWVESRDRARPRGVLALRQELHRKGVARDVVDDVLAARSGRDDDAVPTDAGQADLEAASRLLARRQGTLDRELDPRRRRRKAYALLARHGFTPDVCRRAVAEALDLDHETVEVDADG